jgi:hypothetical protein
MLNIETCLGTRIGAFHPLCQVLHVRLDVDHDIVKVGTYGV